MSIILSHVHSAAVLKFWDRKTANPMIRYCVHTFRELLKVPKLHSNVDPIQDMLCVWRNLPMNSS